MSSQDQGLHRSATLFEQLQQVWPDDALFFDIRLLHWLPDLDADTRSLLLTMPTWNQEPVNRIHMFVDGSSFDQNRLEAQSVGAGWGCVIIFECIVDHHRNHHYFFGAMANPLTHASMDSMEALGVGELLHDALSAEAVGMLWTLAWVAQSPFNVPVDIHYDNQTIGPFAMGCSQWHAAWEYQRLHMNIQAWRHCLQAQGCQYKCHHVKAHAGIPWSECVDALAKAAAKQILPRLNLPQHVSHVMGDRMFRFSWMSVGQTGQLPHPAALRSTFQVEGPFMQQHEDVTWNRPKPQSITMTVKLVLNLRSVNVLTLDAGSKRNQEAGLMLKGRISTLQGQFSEHKCLLVGLQECRTHGQTTRHSASHFVFQSGASPDGTKGCELWVDRHAPYAFSEHAMFKFQASHFHVAAFDPRYLLVVVRAPHLHMRILVLHAPMMEPMTTHPKHGGGI